MSKKYLGEVFDIHTGGPDLIPIHHENEIAQSKGLVGKNPAKFWMHCEFLLVDGGKMGKSLGNAYLIEDLIAKNYSPLAFKLMCFSSHYRNKLNFTWEGLESAQTALNKLRNGYQKHVQGEKNLQSATLTSHLINGLNDEVAEYKRKFLAAINDDLNMPVAMSVIWDIVKNPNKSKALAELLLEFDKVLGLDIHVEANGICNTPMPDEIKELLDRRKIAREEKNWTLSDQIRDELKAKGYEVKDTKDGQEVINV